MPFYLGGSQEAGVGSVKEASMNLEEDGEEDEFGGEDFIIDATPPRNDAWKKKATPIRLKLRTYGGQ